MTTTQNPLDMIVASLKSGKGRISIGRVFDFKNGGSHFSVQVYEGNRKVGPFIMPPEGGDLSDTLKMLGDLVLEKASVTEAVSG